jgi:hypothetical protein
MTRSDFYQPVDLRGDVSADPLAAGLLAVRMRQVATTLAEHAAVGAGVPYEKWRLCMPYAAHLADFTEVLMALAARRSRLLGEEWHSYCYGLTDEQAVRRYAYPDDVLGGGPHKCQACGARTVTGSAQTGVPYALVPAAVRRNPSNQNINRRPADDRDAFVLTVALIVGFASLFSRADPDNQWSPYRHPDPVYQVGELATTTRDLLKNAARADQRNGCSLQQIASPMDWDVGFVERWIYDGDTQPLPPNL